MQLRKFEFDSGQLFDQELAVRPLTVLFGANSSGKTTVLEWIEEILARRERLRYDPAEGPLQQYVTGYVWFCLDNADVHGHADAERNRALKSNLAIGYEDEGIIDLSEVLAGASIDDVEATIADALVSQGSAGSEDDRRCLADRVARSREFFAFFSETHLIADRDSLSVEDLAAAQHIAEQSPGKDDPLGEIARQLTTSSWAFVGAVAEGILESATRAMFPEAIRFEIEPTMLAGLVEDAIPKIHDAIWAMPRYEDSDQYQFVDPFLIRDVATSGHTPDPWLEHLADDATAEPENPFAAADPRAWLRVRASVRSTASLLADHVNACLPTFVAEQGRVDINVLPLSAWHSADSRVRLTFRERASPDDGEMKFGEPRSIEVLGAGTARWITAAVRRACLELMNGRRRFGDRFAELDELAPDHEAFDAARREDPSERTAVLSPRPFPAIYLIDEPEAHLHPAAVRSVADWLVELSSGASAVIVATHHPTLLDLPTECASAVLVQRDTARTRLIEVGPDIDLLTDAAAIGLGLRQSELLLFTRLFLFVEGPHDAAVLEAWFGRELVAAGVKIIPIHGTQNALALLDSELVRSLGIKMATFTDRTVQSRVDTDPKSPEEHQINRLRKEARQNGLDIPAFGHTEYDIVQLFDEEVVRRHAPRFPGWKEVDLAWKDAGRAPWKSWVTATYGLALHRDAVAKLALDCAEAGAIPNSLTRTIKEVRSLAKDRQPR
jgi:hypothetical protein